MPARLGRARLFDAGAVQDLTAATTAVGLLRWASEDDGGLTSAPTRRIATSRRVWPGLGNGCARTFEHRAEKARSGGGPLAGGHNGGGCVK